MAVICSCLLVLAIATLCSAGTVPNRPAFPVATDQIQTQSGGKASPRRVMHPAFANAGQAPGLEIWRIENFEPARYPQKDYGKFYTGDSYIVMNTVETKDKKRSWDVHFWLGAETSSDEAGAAAIHTVQLDDLLNGLPVQHREVQDHESQLFLGYFKNGVRYEQGGVSTGFKHVDPNAPGEKRLFQVKGKRNVRVRQVDATVASMNKGDCFILDSGTEIFVFVGDSARRVEKLKAISAANQIRDQDHNGRAKVNIIDDFTTEDDKAKFFTALGSGSYAEVPDWSVAEDDEAFEIADAAAVTLYKVSDASGKLKIDPISTKPLRQEMLDTHDCFILDTRAGIYVWVGKGATQKEKTDAMLKAQEFLRAKKYPSWTQIHRTVEGAESAPFKQYFATWRDAGMAHTRLIRSALGFDTDDSELTADEVDAVVKNLKKSGGRAIGFMPDNGLQDLPETIIQFVRKADSGEVSRQVLPFDTKQPLLGIASYILKYKYLDAHGDSGIIVYVWEGARSSEEAKERAYKAGLALAMEQHGVLVRTPQNHEPRHFLKLFRGNLMTHFTDTPFSPRLYRIRGTDASDVHASAVKTDSSSLSSRDVFALVNISKKRIFIWVGVGASKFEQKVAHERFHNFWPDLKVEVIEEGAEPDDFWEYLHGEGVYDRSTTSDGAPVLEPRLFHCRLVGTSRIIFEEIVNFEQEDLDIEGVMLLDRGDEIYMWLGQGTHVEENRRLLEMIKEYVRLEPTHRSIENVSIMRILEGYEPRVFKLMFPQWDDNYWQGMVSYDDVKKQVKEHNARIESNAV